MSTRPNPSRQHAARNLKSPVLYSGQCAWGQRFADDGITLVVDEYEQNVTAVIRHMRASGYKLRQIVDSLRELGVVGRTGKPIGTKNFVKSVTQVSSTALPPGAVTNEQKYPPAASWAYNSTTGVWTGYLQASKLSQGKKYVFTVLLSDGTSFLVTFGVR